MNMPKDIEIEEATRNKWIRECAMHAVICASKI